MKVWKIVFLSKWVICRFHVNLPGCKCFFFSFQWSIGAPHRLLLCLCLVWRSFRRWPSSRRSLDEKPWKTGRIKRETTKKPEGNISSGQTEIYLNKIWTDMICFLSLNHLWDKKEIIWVYLHTIHNQYRLEHMWATFTALIRFHYTDWFIGILMMACCNPYITRSCNPSYTANNQGVLVTALVTYGWQSPQQITSSDTENPSTWQLMRTHQDTTTQKLLYICTYVIPSGKLT